MPISTQNLAQFLENDLNLMPLKTEKGKEKFPLYREWTEKRFSKSDVIDHEGNVGWAIDVGYLVIDIDPRNGGHDSYAKLTKRIGEELTPTVVTPSCGFHIYMKLPELYHNKSFSKTLKDYPGIDFLTKGAQCVIPGSSIDRKPYEWTATDGLFWQETPQALLDMISYDRRPANDLGDLGDVVGNSTMTREDME